MTTLFNGFKKAELVEAARVLHVDVEPGDTVEQIKAGILDAGFTEEDYYKTIGEDPEYSDALPATKAADGSDEEQETGAEDNPALENHGEDEPEEELVYARFLGRNLSLQTKHGRFSRTRPMFKIEASALKELEAQHPGRFRKATAQERKAL